MADSLSALGDTVPERKQSLFDLLGTAATRRMDYLSALKGMAGSLMTLPQRALGAAGELQRTGDQYNPEPAVETAMTMAGARFPTVKTGEMGVFGGRLARSADQAALAMAEEMAAKGASREQILKDTGWFQGAEGKWRFEIPDTRAALTDAKTPQPHRLDVAQDIFEKQGLPRAGFANPKYSAETSAALRQADEQLAAADTHRPLSTYVSHPELYSAYPQIGEIPTLKNETFAYKGSFMPGEDPHMSIADTLGYGKRSHSDTLSTALHEIQHAVQNVEGTARGANTLGLRPNTPAWDIYQERLNAIRDSGKMSREEFSQRGGYEGLAPQKEYDDFVKSTKRIDPSIDRSAQEYAVQEAYRRHAGEVEARNVQARMNMTPEQRRSQPPWTTEDVPVDQQIVR